MSDKPIYVISIVSELLGLHPQTLRQYERMGLISPSRTLGNTRLYSEEDVERLKFILTLTKDMGVNLAGVEIIINMKEQINELQNNIEQLTTYIKQNMSDRSPRAEDKAIIPSPPKSIIKVKIETE